MSSQNLTEERATWYVGMYLDGNYDGEATCRATEAAVAAAATEPSGGVYILAEQLKQAVEEHIYAIELGGSLLGDFAGYMLSHVDWHEIAKDRLYDYNLQHAS